MFSKLFDDKTHYIMRVIGSPKKAKRQTIIHKERAVKVEPNQRLVPRVQGQLAVGPSYVCRIRKTPPASLANEITEISK